MSKDVIFRRIRGRVIPIKVEPKGVIEGAAIAAGGVALGAATGLTDAMITLRASKIRSFARSAEIRAAKFQSAGRFNAYIKGMKTSERLMRRFGRAKALSKAVTNYGQAGSAALIGIGINKALKHTNLKNKTETRVSVATFGGIGSSFLIRHLHDARFFKDTNTIGALKSSINLLWKTARRVI